MKFRYLFMTMMACMLAVVGSACNKSEEDALATETSEVTPLGEAIASAVEGMTPGDVRYILYFADDDKYMTVDE